MVQVIEVHLRQDCQSMVIGLHTLEHILLWVAGQVVLKVIHVRLQDVECEILIDRHLRVVEAFVAKEYWKMMEKDWAF